MIVGNLPLIDRLDDDDVILCSDDDQHVKRLKGKDIKGGRGRGLIYWEEDENKIYRLEVNEGDKWFDNGRFEVAGNAEVIVKETTKTIEDSFTVEGAHYQATVVDKRWIFRRTSNTRVLGGLCGWRLWDDVENSRLPDHPVSDGDGHNIDSTKIYLPGWALISTKREDLTYQFIEVDVSTGEETLLETIIASDVKYTDPKTGLEYYISGYPDPTVYEPMFMDLARGWLNSPWMYVQKFPKVIDGSIQTTNNDAWDYDELLWGIQYAGQIHRYPVSDERPFERTGIYYKRLNGRYEVTSQGTIIVDDGPVYLNRINWGKRFDLTSMDVFLDNNYASIQQVGSDFYGLWSRDRWVNGNHYIYDDKPSVNLLNMKISSFTGYPDPLNNPFNVAIGTISPSRDIDSYKWGGFEFAWLGCVDNLFDIPYTTQSGLGKDIFHYIFHDAGIESPAYYFTAIDDGVGPDSEYAFYTGMGNSSVDPKPDPKEATFKVKRTGEVDATSYLLNGEPLEGIQTVTVETSGMGTNPVLLATITTDSDEKDIYSPRVTWEGEYESSTGVKIGEINFGSESYEVYSPGGGGGGSNISISNIWSPELAAKQRIATFTVNNITYDIYSPTSTVSDMSITPDYNTGNRIARIATVRGSDQQVTNHDIYIPDYSLKFGYAADTKIDYAGSPMTANGGPYTFTINSIKTTRNGSTDFKFTKGVWAFDLYFYWKLPRNSVYAQPSGQDAIEVSVTNLTNAGTANGNGIFNRQFIGPTYAGESGIGINIPVSGFLTVSSDQALAPSIDITLTHHHMNITNEIDYIHYDLVLHKIGEY